MKSDSESGADFLVVFLRPVLDEWKMPKLARPVHIALNETPSILLGDDRRFLFLNAVIPRQGSIMCTFDVILHPTDFSEDSGQAFQLACNMARDQFASLVVVHVLPPETSTQGKSEADVNEDPGPVIQNCRDQFSLMRARAADIPVSFRIAFGNPVGSILRVAHEERAELIVVASHRHSQFHLQLHGSVTEGVLRQTHCPVVVLRQPSPTFKPRSQASTGTQSG